MVFEGIIKDNDDEHPDEIEYLGKLINNIRISEKKIILYSGALDGHVSFYEFIKIFDNEIVRDNFHLILTGYSSDSKCIETFSDKSFINYLGLIEESHLDYLAFNCDILLNLRNSNVVSKQRWVKVSS